MKDSQSNQTQNPRKTIHGISISGQSNEFCKRKTYNLLNHLLNLQFSAFFGMQNEEKDN